MQFVFDRQQEENPDESVNSEVFWRPELLKMILAEPNINKFDGYHLAQGDNSVYFTVGTLFSNDMNKNRV